MACFYMIKQQKAGISLAFEIIADHWRFDQNQESQNLLETDKIIRLLNCSEYRVKFALSGIWDPSS